MSRACVIGSLLRSGCGDSRGAVALLVAVMLVGIIGFVALGTEIVMLLATSRHMQSAADDGALAAVSARIRGYPADYKQEAYALVRDADPAFNNGQGAGCLANPTLYVGPPCDGTHSDYIEVLIRQPQTLSLASLVYTGPFAVSARAVAHSSGYGSCILVLDPVGAGSLSMNGAFVVNFPGCDVSVNSSSATAVSLVGGGSINAKNVYIVGAYSAGGGSLINVTGTITTHAPATDNPYRDYILPSAAGTCIPDPDVKTSKSIPPGTYCSISVSTSAGRLTLAPGGNYIIKGGKLSVSATATLTGTGVTIVLAGAATADIQSGATVTLAAPPAGAAAGVPGLAFFQDPAAPTGATSTFNGGPAMNIAGALYFPTQELRFGGGSGTVPCIELIAWKVTISGNATLNVDKCPGTGVLPIGEHAALVE